MPEAGQATHKGQQTREEILRAALGFACTVGLDGMSIGALAEKTGLSKSGLYAHFESKEALQCAVLDTAADMFTDLVLRPAIQEPRGLPRIERLFDLWVDWKDETFGGGCPIIAAATDFDDRPGAIHDKVKYYIDEMIGVIARAAEIAVEEGHFDKGLDIRQFAYEFWGLLLAQQHYHRLLQHGDANLLAKRAFDSLVERAAHPSSLS